MKNVRFYLEYKTRKDKIAATVKEPGKHTGNVVAIFVNEGWFNTKGFLYTAIGSLYDTPNSPVCGTSVSYEYLSAVCKRIPEKLGREIHPELFKYLDD